MNRSSGALLKICFSVLLRLCHLLQSETGYCQKWSENRTDFFFVFKLEFSWSILDGEMLICYWYRDYRGVGGSQKYFCTLVFLVDLMEVLICYWLFLQLSVCTRACPSNKASPGRMAVTWSVRMEQQDSTDVTTGKCDQFY